jgi:predicted histidine transporter YuiF (NhaC family)
MTPLVFSIVSGALTLLLGLVMALFKYSVDREKIEQERRFKESDEKRGELRKDLADVNTRLHAEELATAKMHGEMKLAAQTSETLTGNIGEIKEFMKQVITKAEFESRMNNSDKMLTMILQRVDANRHASSDQHQRVGPPKDDRREPR